MNLALYIKFGALYVLPNRPIVFCIDGDSTFEANFVLATLADPASQSQASCSQLSTQQGLRPTGTSVSARKSAPSVAQQRAPPRTASIR